MSANTDETTKPDYYTRFWTAQIRFRTLIQATEVLVGPIRA